MTICSREVELVMIEEITNDAFKEGDIPKPNAHWDELCKFALSFNGYNYWGFEKCSEIANRYSDAFRDDQTLPESLTELRTCLFFEQRRWHHCGFDPDEEALKYIHALVGGISKKIMSTTK